MTFFFFLPSMLLSGFMFPFRGMPGWAQWIGEVLPAHALPAPRARHPAQGQRLGRSLAEHLAADRVHGRGHGHRGDLLPQDAGLTMKRALTCILLLIAVARRIPFIHPKFRPPEQYTPTPVTEERLAPGEGHPGAMVDAVPVAGARRPGAPGAARRAPRSPVRGAKLRQAQEDLSARTGGTRFPKVDAKLSANRVDVNPQSLGVQALPVPDAVQPLSRLGRRVLYLRSFRRAIDASSRPCRPGSTTSATSSRRRASCSPATWSPRRSARHRCASRSSRPRRSSRCRSASSPLPSGW